MAPGAELIVVTNSVTTEAIGDSASTLDAVRYILEKAAALGRSVVINMNQGDNIGPHDGTSLLEEGIGNLLGGGPGKCMVKSAGNEGVAGRHAMGTVTAGAGETVRFVVDPGDTSREIIDIWYPAADRYSFRITPPGGSPSAVVDPGRPRPLLDQPEGTHPSEIHIHPDRGVVRTRILWPLDLVVRLPAPRPRSRPHAPAKHATRPRPLEQRRREQQVVDLVPSVAQAVGAGEATVVEARVAKGITQVGAAQQRPQRLAVRRVSFRSPTTATNSAPSAASPS
jgi:hypothetical protein